MVMIENLIFFGIIILEKKLKGLNFEPQMTKVACVNPF